MSATLKPGISRAKRMMMASRKPIAMLVDAQRKRLEEIENRLARLMSKRAEEEATLGELLEYQNARTSDEDKEN